MTIDISRSFPYWLYNSIWYDSPKHAEQYSMNSIHQRRNANKSSFRHQVGSNIKTDYLHMKRHCLPNKSTIEWSIVFFDLWKYFGFILSVFYISFVTMMWFLSFGRLWFGRRYFEDKQVLFFLKQNPRRYEG